MLIGQLKPRLFQQASSLARPMAHACVVNAVSRLSYGEVGCCRQGGGSTVAAQLGAVSLLQPRRHQQRPERR